ncbi:MAG: ABC transporter permease [Bacteroidetes bacterium]|nr:ABC transporter permease [Bacteroidota bacterium]MBU1485584.1 ABC transporter permease [Bacteroidota bacterium]MBU2268544.1 ABC transporter permease [Bacteroidota bacterium]MBU2374774.1 ABC transporter permease [Bacteroidota bacterium]
MIKNYFKIAIRSFVKDRTYAIINLIGLAISLTGVLIILAYVKYELSFDHYYSHSPRIYRIAVEQKKDSIVEKTLTFPDPLAYTLKNEFPEIESVSKLIPREVDFVINNKISHVDLIKVDSNFLNIFDLPFLYGDRKTALIKKGNIVLTESTAKKLFPKQNVIGKELKYRDHQGVFQTYIVSGVIKDIPPNTHFHTEAIVSESVAQETLNWSSYSTTGFKYIMLKKEADIRALQKKVLSIYKKYEFPKSVNILFQPVTSIHLHSNIEGEYYKNSSIKNIYIFSFVAFLILFIACINYINLTIARSLQRVKEVGMRKVMGADKNQLAVQFISESIIFFCIALPVSFFIAYLFWPLFTDIAGIKADRVYLLNYEFIALVILLSFIIGILSGAYPAFFLSKLEPSSILKNGQKSFRVNLNIRKALIVFQFVISIALIVSTIIVHRQYSLLTNMPLGFSKNDLIILPKQNFNGKAGSFKNELKTSKDILDVSFSSWKLSQTYAGSASMTHPSDSTKEWDFGFVAADLDFLKTLQIKLIEGNDFSTSPISASLDMDSLLNPQGKRLSRKEFIDFVNKRPIIVTKSTTEGLGLKRPVVGQVLTFSALQGTVIGEIADFNGISLLEKSPMVVIQADVNPDFGNTYLRINSKNIPQTLDFIKKKWEIFFPESNFEYSFMEDQIAELYKEQQRLATLFTTFAILAIVISLMGLFSLVALIAQQKTKEIGIRIVLGATVIEIISLLSRSFIKLILVAFIIATPLVLWIMNIWLQDYQYRISISWEIFLITGLGCLFFALLIVSFQAIKAAVANPIKSLRTE